jgi:hypothetical protein
MIRRNEIVCNRDDLLRRLSMGMEKQIANTQIPPLMLDSVL